MVRSVGESNAPADREEGGDIVEILDLGFGVMGVCGLVCQANRSARWSATRGRWR